jgi:serine carboxypeptidase-like clade 1
MANKLLLLLLLATASYGCGCEAAVAQPERRRNTITHIKGFDGPLPFSLETGYIEVDETHGAELFYYFIESERSPAEDPLILWITGGPGCSSLYAMLFEIGPLRFDVDVFGHDKDNDTETEDFPRLVYFEHSWTKVSNVIFLDAPVGTGFSYAREEEGLNVSLTGTGRQLRIFLEKWVARHPKFATNPLYIGGDSASGNTVPVAVLEIANNPNGGELLNLKGYMVGNPLTDDKYDSGGKVPYKHGMGLISDELYQAAQGSCGGDFVTTPRNAQCADALEAISQATADINTAHILEPVCDLDLPLRTSITRRLLQVQGEEDKRFGCHVIGYWPAFVWADDQEVRKTLGIREGSVGAWSRCTTLSHYQTDVLSIIPYHRHLTQHGYRALVYSGDHDMVLTFVGTQAWIKSLEYPVVAPWRPWYTDHQVAGFTTEYAYNLTFATVKGAGHTAPEYRPKECLRMLDRWTSSAGRL